MQKIPARAMLFSVIDEFNEYEDVCVLLGLGLPLWGCYDASGLLIRCGMKRKIITIDFLIECIKEEIAQQDWRQDSDEQFAVVQ